MMTSRRMSSSHWNHFIRLDFSKARCRYCQRVISMSRGSTGNLSRHMKLKHPAIAHHGDAPEAKENGSDSPVPIGEEIEVEIHEDDNEMKQPGEDPAPSESYCNTIILEPTDYKHPSASSMSSHSSALLHRRRKQQRLSFDVMRKVSQPSREEDEFSTMGRNIANKLRKLPLEKVPVVEKLITDVIFEAQCGNVTQSSRITFYDMRNTSLRHPNMQPVPSPPPGRPASKPECSGQKPEGQNLPPNVVFLVPQAEGQKAIPLNVQMVSVAKADSLTPKPSELPADPLTVVKQEDRSSGPE